MRSFQYHQPKTGAEAIALLRKLGEKAYPLAGGTDLIAKMKARHLSPEHVISLRGLKGLNFIKRTGRSVRIGALTPLRDIEKSPLLSDGFQMLRSAAREVGSVQIRNVGTIGGNLCNASPSADTAPPLMALRAEAKIIGPRGGRRIPLEDFFAGPGRTALRRGELLSEIYVPLPGPGTGSVYIKLGVRRAMDIAIVGVAALITLDPRDRTCRLARIALGAVAPTPIRAFKAEELLAGKALDDDLIERAAALASRAAKPITDVRASADYRREMVEVLTRRALKTALREAESSV